MKLNELQRFLKNFFFRIVSTLVTAVLGILTISHLSTALQAEGFGRYSFIVTYTSYFVFFTSLGVDVAAIRIMAVDSNRVRETFASLVPLKFILSAAVFVAMIIPSLFMEKLHGYGPVLFIFASTMLPLAFTVQPVFEATKRMEFPSIIAILTQAVNYALIVHFVKGPGDLMPVALITLATTLLPVCSHMIVYIRYYGKWTPRYDARLWKQLIGSGVIIGLIQVTIQLIHYIDILLLGFLVSDAEIGIYSAAYKVFFMVLTVMGIVHNLATPILFERHGKGAEAFRGYFNQYMKLMIFSGVLVAALLVLLARPILDLVYDLRMYEASVPLFRILAVSIFLININSAVSIGLLSYRREKLFLFIVLGELSANIALNLVLIPHYGLLGSAIATVSTEIIGTVFYLATLRRILNFSFVPNICKAVLSGIPMVVFVYFSPLPFIANAVIGGFIMVVFSVIFRGYTLNEILHIKNNLFNTQ